VDLGGKGGPRGGFWMYPKEERLKGGPERNGRVRRRILSVSERKRG